MVDSGILGYLSLESSDGSIPAVVKADAMAYEYNCYLSLITSLYIN